MAQPHSWSRARTNPRTRILGGGAVWEPRHSAIHPDPGRCGIEGLRPSLPRRQPRRRLAVAFAGDDRPAHATLRANKKPALLSKESGPLLLLLLLLRRTTSQALWSRDRHADRPRGSVIVLIAAVSRGIRIRSPPRGAFIVLTAAVSRANPTPPRRQALRRNGCSRRGQAGIRIAAASNGNRSQLLSAGSERHLASRRIAEAAGAHRRRQRHARPHRRSCGACRERD